MTFNFQGVHGPDVSFYQDDNSTPQGIDFKKMKAAGASFVIIRAGQNKWIDPDFSANYIEAKLAGLPRGLYWFYDDRIDPAVQASLCLSLLGNDYPEIGVWLDIELDYGGAFKGWLNWRKFLDAIKAKTQQVGVYTGPSYWITHRPTGAADLAYFKSFPLWIANYGVDQPLVPGPWDYAVLWQIGTPAVGIAYGVESLEIDMNYWNGSPESFRAFFGLGDAQPPEPPTEIPEVIMQGTVNASITNLVVRDATGADTGKRMRAGDRVYGAVTNGRIYFLHIYRATGTLEEQPGNAATQYMTLADVPEPATASVYLPDYLIAHFPNGETRKYLPE